ncbi:MAG: addiction module protein [Planctomycetes bacterium]|nr:addiction module protein [Planctomycetota bacterium]
MEAAELPISKKQKAEIDRRIDAMDGDSELGIPWEEVMDRIRGRAQ